MPTPTHRRRSARAAWRDWLRAHAIPFHPARGPSAALLRALHPGLATARVVLFGESADASREIINLRLAVLRALHAQFSLLGTPWSPAVAARVNAFLRGEAALLEQTMSSSAQQHFLAGLRRSRSLRTQLQLFGYADGNDASARNATYAALSSDLSVHQHPRVRDLVRLLSAPDGESLIAERERIAWALDYLDLQFAPLTDALGGNCYSDTRNLLHWLHGALAGDDAADSRLTQVAYALAERWPDSRAIIVGDCAELLKCDAGVVVAPAVAGQHSIGDFVHRTLLPTRALNLWAVKGAVQGVVPSRRARVSAPRLDAYLGELDCAFALPLQALDDPRAAPLREPLALVMADGRTLTLQVQEQVDALFYLPTANPVP